MSEAVWHETCPVCGGTGQIGLFTGPRLPKAEQKHEDITTKCDACDGKGVMLIVKKIRKRKDK